MVMNGQVHLAAKEGVFYFFGKKTLALHFVETQVLHEVAFGLDNDQFALYADTAEFSLGEFGLPKGQFTTVGTYPKH